MKKTLILCILAVMALSVVAQEPTQERRARFAWGASLTGNVDMSGNDMSTMGFDAYFGMELPVMQMLGVGMGLDMPVSNSLRQMPVYLIARTNFLPRRTLCFLDARGGLSMNDVEKNRAQWGPYASVGLGFNLASTSKFSSHLILSYSYFGRVDYDDAEGQKVSIHDLHGATVRLGVCF